MLAHAPVEPPKLKGMQSGRASISLRSSVAAGPRPRQGVSPTATAEKRAERPKPVDDKPPAAVKPVAKSEAPRSFKQPGPKVPEPGNPSNPSQDKEQPAATRTKEAPVPLQETQPAPSPSNESPKVVAERESAAARGSAGSRGVVDGLPQDLASNPDPPYPPEALRARLEGTVILRIKIDAKGKVTSVQVHESSEVPALDQSALDTARQWVFEPARRRGVPVPYEFLKPVEFFLNRRR